VESGPDNRTDGRAQGEDVFALINPNSIQHYSTSKQLPQTSPLIWHCFGACITGAAVNAPQQTDVKNMSVLFAKQVEL